MVFSNFLKFRSIFEGITPSGTGPQWSRPLVLQTTRGIATRWHLGWRAIGPILKEKDMVRLRQVRHQVLRLQRLPG